MEQKLDLNTYEEEATKIANKGQTPMFVGCDGKVIGLISVTDTLKETSAEAIRKMKEMGIETDPLYWYLDLRKYGTDIHSGFGLGFERLLMYITGIENIRDVIPFPRTPNNCEF